LFGGNGKKSVGPIGIDVGRYSVKMLQLRQTVKGFKVVALASHRLPNGLCTSDKAYMPSVGECVKQMLLGGKFIDNKFIGCLPDASVHYKNLRVPNMPADEIATAVQWEAGERLVLSTDQVATQYFLAGQVRQGNETRQEVILVASADTFVQQYVTMFDNCGLEPVGMEVVPAALSKYLGEQDDTDQEDAVQLIIDLGYGSTKVLILRGSQVVFYKNIDIGGCRFDALISKQLNVSLQEAASLRKKSSPQLRAGQDPTGSSDTDDVIERTVGDATRGAVDDLVREIGLCLRYYSVTFRGHRPESAWLTGGESQAPWLVSVLGHDLDIDVHTVDPLAAMDMSAAQSQYDAAWPRSLWTTAAGLALCHASWQARKGAA
jgi:type IV pilus assembly protein PilM